MGIEIERKFLVKSDGWRKLGCAVRYAQGYLCSDRNRTVRVRTVGDKGFLTVKGRGSGIAHPEYEYEIPYNEARTMLDELAEKPVIAKTRTKIPFAGFVWEVDEFFGDNEGLVMAEIELPSVDASFEKPEWIGEEVTGDPRYYNSMLARNPYKKNKQCPTRAISGITLPSTRMPAICRILSVWQFFQSKDSPCRYLKPNRPPSSRLPPF